jgi:hypothetical protein
VVAKPYSLLGLFELDEPEQATSLFVIVSTVGSLLSSVVSGILSDRSGALLHSQHPRIPHPITSSRTHAHTHHTRA